MLPGLSGNDLALCGLRRWPGYRIACPCLAAQLSAHLGPILFGKALTLFLEDLLFLIFG